MFKYLGPCWLAESTVEYFAYLPWSSTSLIYTVCPSPGFFSILAFICHCLTMTDACACSFTVSVVLFWDGCVMMAKVGGICDIGLWNSLTHMSLPLSISYSCVSHASNTKHARHLSETCDSEYTNYEPTLRIGFVVPRIGLLCLFFRALHAWHVISLNWSTQYEGIILKQIICFLQVRAIKR